MLDWTGDNVVNHKTYCHINSPHPICLPIIQTMIQLITNHYFQKTIEKLLNAITKLFIGPNTSSSRIQFVLLNLCMTASSEPSGIRVVNAGGTLQRVNLLNMFGAFCIWYDLIEDQQLKIPPSYFQLFQIDSGTYFKLQSAYKLDKFVYNISICISA